ncbi:hypothetical protein N0V90_005244 [Kalmusia sp. IMI 367209]|nr:hypothetical protein N0V90_005244 [Kalmusia sp. IMI 367209]
MSDPRVHAIDNFTRTTHSSPGPTLPPPSNPPPNFTACIIGAARGIGAGIALSYARAGASALVLATRLSSLPTLSTIVTQLASLSPSTSVYVHAVDVADASSMRALAAFAKEKLRSADTGAPRLDVVALNSGYSGNVHLKVTDGDAAADGEWARAFGVNALGTYHVAHYFIPLLLGSPAGSAKVFAVVGTVGACIRRGIIANSKYCISKMAQVRIVEHVAEQFGDEGVLAVAVHPGAVDSEMARETAPEEFKKYLVDDPELCGAFLVWLTRQSHELKWLNGRLLSANWDPDELLERKDDVINGDLLKFEARTTL